MSDPAVEAAQRAEHPAWAFVDPPGAAKDIAERAAREALTPIRELHKCGLTDNPYYPNDTECVECQEDWPCATARLVYAEEEL